MSRHVVFGTGQVGRLVVDELVGRGIDVVAVNRSAGDARPTSSSRPRVTAGADVVYFCLNASHYDKWDVEFPPLQRGVVAGAAGRGRPARRARQPLLVRPDRRPPARRVDAAASDLLEGRDPRGDDRRAAPRATSTSSSAAPLTTSGLAPRSRRWARPCSAGRSRASAPR